MKRNRIIFGASAVAVFVLAAIFAQKKPASSLLVLDWASKCSLERPPLAVLIEFGHKDTTPVDWSGEVTAANAKIVHREGYRFRPGAGDKLTDAGWKASSHRGIRVPQGQPAVARQEGIATIGVVLHLNEIQSDAALLITVTGEDKAKVKLPLADVLAGKPASILDGKGVVRLVSTAMPIATGNTEDDFPAACYGPDGTLWVAWVAYHVLEDSRRIEARNFREQPKDFKAYYTPEFRDQIFAKSYRDGKWSEPIPVTGAREDIVRCAIASDAAGNVAVIYSTKRDGRYDLFARAVSPKVRQETKITKGELAAYLSPVAITSQSGEILIGAQGWHKEGLPGYHVMTGLAFQENGWSARGSTSGGAGSHWHTAIAAGVDEWTLASDRLIPTWDHDVTLPVRGNATGFHSGGTENPVASSSRFEARPSVTYDPAGRLWIAYEEGPELWGKDYGPLAVAKGEPLYSSRSVRVVCLVDGKLMAPVAELPTSNVRLPHVVEQGGATGPGYEKAARYAYPQIGIDGKGRVWLTYRQKFGSRYSSHPGSYWLTFARRLDGDKWSEPIELHHSCGLLDHRPVLLPHKSGGLLVVHNTDGRYTTPNRIDNDIYLSYLDLPGEPVEPKLTPHSPGEKKPELVARAERESQAVKRIRDYRIDVDGKNYRLLRGDFHRHTEISWDGGPDGSLEDMFRYAIDVAQFDWIANTDHDNGGGREYSWWLTQKFIDAYTIPGRFTGIFGYERSVVYPHGHRNCLFAKRGVRTLPRLAEADQEKRVGGIHADDTKMLYRYLHEMGGICASHTSATSMGTDWRDNDPVVEPLVEIYQGDRMSYEKEEAPRAGYDPKTNKKPANIAGWYPKGFIDHALGEKGYRLGFESSSDHWSTHISYCVVLSEKNDRESIIEAMRKRHTYGATDDIICDVRCDGHVMGDEFKIGGAPKLQVKIIGTSDLAKVEVLRDSDVVATLKLKGRECAEEWTDPQPAAGTHYYYIRVQQKDGELAWTSPMWIQN
jgi:hypothetical protein